jgi:hypothetical protein
MQTHRRNREFDIEDGQRIMLRCAMGYIVASATAAGLGFAGLGKFALGSVVLLLALSALLLAAGLLCSALGTLESTERPDRRDRRSP